MLLKFKFYDYEIFIIKSTKDKYLNTLNSRFCFFNLEEIK